MSLSVALVLVASGCSGGDDDAQGPGGGGASTSAAPPLATTAKVTKLTGKLRPKRRKAVVRQVKAVVDGWWDAAYLSPGKDDPFPGFTRGAADLARHDRDIMTAAALPHGADEPVAVHRSVGLDVLAVHGRPAGVTAHVWLAVRPAAGADHVVAVRGLLELSRQDGKWQVFGYSMTAGPPPAPHHDKKQHHQTKHHQKKQHHQRKHHHEKRAHHRKGKSS